MSAPTLFPPPLRPVPTPPNPLDDAVTDRGRYVATFTPCRRHRYTLTILIGDGPPGVFVMLNPSTADADRLDPTLRRVRGFAEAFGWGSITILNAFTFRATDPRSMLAEPEPNAPGADEAIRQMCLMANGRTVVGWGVHGRHRGRDAEVLAILRGIGSPASALGTTKDGHPRHPLYLPKTARPVAFPPTATA